MPQDVSPPGKKVAKSPVEISREVKYYTGRIMKRAGRVLPYLIRATASVAFTLLVFMAFTYVSTGGEYYVFLRPEEGCYPLWQTCDYVGPYWDRLGIMAAAGMLCYLVVEIGVSTRRSNAGLVRCHGNHRTPQRRTRDPRQLRRNRPR